MRSLSDVLLLLVPGLAALALLLLFAMPVETVVPLAPNVAFVLTILIATFAPAAWPRWLAFLTGLLQDVLTGTPLGSQALLALLLVEMVHANARRQQYQLLRIRWMEATGVLVLMQALLWLMIRAVAGQAPALQGMLFAGLVSGVWYPLFYFLAQPLLHRMPGRA